MTLPAERPRRSELDVMKAQIRAVTAWQQARHLQDRAAETVTLTREMRLDRTRRMEARRREQRALVAQTDEQLRRSGELISQSYAVRAVLAHRNGWLRDKVTARLNEHGVQVVAAVDDGADAAGTLVAEQPDLVLVEDRLPTVTGLEVVQRAKDFAPDAFIAALVEDSSSIAAMVDAGAGAVFTRRIPPGEVADQLVSCLAGLRQPLVLA